MKIRPASEKKLPLIIFYAQVSLIGIMIALIIAGTIYAFARSSGANPIIKFGKSNEQAQTARPAGNLNDDIRVFSGIGRLRIPLSNSSIMILSIAFPYSASDTAFTEELAAKVGEFRGVIGDYFSSLPEEKLIIIDEETAKTQILERFNANLRLGRIEALYFSEMMVIDGNY